LKILLQNLWPYRGTNPQGRLVIGFFVHWLAAASLFEETQKLNGDWTRETDLKRLAGGDSPRLDFYSK
jgi:hypothetical protein